ncbi:MAG: vitamin B12-transporter protein BtuF [Deltaproteobacteria bacterium ADurb.Bin510]|nr:MAG: vitamin B12-transporter protein BtuF [Deltaproteobacteria bacterium ADurb.Bin510]
MQAEFLRLGELLGERQRAAAINRRVDAALGAAPLKYKPKVLWLVSIEPLITVNDATFTAEFIRRAGGRNVFGGLSTRYPCVNIEEIVARQPEVIIVVAGHGNRLDLSSLAGLPAVKNRQVYYLAADAVCQPTPLQFLKGYGLVRGVLARSQPRSGSPGRSRAR